MLVNIRKIEGRGLKARDGVIGQIEDVYYDDHVWQVRYFVVATGSWLNRRHVLISPEALGPTDWTVESFPVDLTKEQVRNSPGIDTDRPVSRQHEEELRGYYGWPPYWGAPLVEGGLAAPVATTNPPVYEAGRTESATPSRRTADPALRSINETMGYHIEAIDGAIGHVEDILIDEHGWRIRYMVIDTRNWWPGKKVVIAPGWISGISWKDRSVRIDLTRDAIKRSPAYDPARPWNATYAAELHDHYGRPRYSDWDKDITAGSGRKRQE